MYGKWNLVSYLIEALGVEGTQTAAWLTVGGVLICIIVPYLLGSFNFGLIISKKKYHDDIRDHGSGNAGTTNMLRTYGKRAAILTLLGDMLKAFVAVSIGYLVLGVNIVRVNEAGVAVEGYRDEMGAAIAGLFVMIGHMFPIFYKFKGGKGVATSAVVVLMISPISFLFCFFTFAIIVIGTKFVSLGSCMGMILYPIILGAFSNKENPTACATAVLMALLVVFAHRENLKRLAAGKESKISFGKKKREEPAPVEEEEPAAPAPQNIRPMLKPGATHSGKKSNKKK